jgi:hypothetical protein
MRSPMRELREKLGVKLNETLGGSSQRGSA